MLLHELNINNFRNIKKQQITFSNLLNICYGNNAQGKTNLLESIFCMAHTKSHRTRNDREIINHNEKFFSIEVKVNQEEKLFYSCDNDLTRIFKYNNEKISPMDFAGIFNCIMFTPDDAEIIKGSPGIRRKVFNMEYSKLDREFMYDLKKYKKLIEQRNVVLKNKTDFQLLDVYDSQISQFASRIVFTLRKFTAELSSYYTDIIKQINPGDELCRIEYVSNVPDDIINLENIRRYFQNLFEKKREYDILTGNSNIGPHRDEYRFFIGNKLLKNFGSQGQIKSSVLAFKLAVMEYIKNQKGFYPVLLLDDISSELDKNRLEYFLNYIINRGQILITTTSINNFSSKIIEKARIFKVNKGEIVIEKI